MYPIPIFPNNMQASIQQIAFALLHPIWRIIDFLYPKRSDYWAFSTHHIHTGRFIENQRAMFEHIKAKAQIRKVIFYRGGVVDFDLEDAINYEVVRHGSLRGLWLLLHCKVVFLTHSITMDYSFRWAGKGFSIMKLNLARRIVVNLWHGIPLKRLLYVANEETRKHTDRVHYRQVERSRYAGLIASSDIDSYAMAAMFYPLNYQQIWLTGLPRNDFLLMQEGALPRYIRESINIIRDLKNGRRMVLYAPTYRQTAICQGATYYHFSEIEIAALRELLHKHNAILGYRPHYFKNSKEYFNMDQFIDNKLIYDLSQSMIPELSAAARECDVLITDYSSVYIETLYLNKPAICFAYDLDHYVNSQDGLLYDMSLLFPSGICRKFQDVLNVLDEMLAGTFSEDQQQPDVARKLFFKYRDCSNSARVYNNIKARLNTAVRA